MSSSTSTAALAFGDCVEKLQRAHNNHVARMVGLSLLDSEKRVSKFEGEGVCNLQFVGEGDANISVHFADADAPVRLDVEGAWKPEWSTDPSTRIVVSALEHSKVLSCTRELARLGRAVTFKEPCASFELPATEWDAWCSGGADWVTSPELDTASVGAAYGLPAGYTLRTLKEGDAELVNSTWKYRTERSIEMVRLSIATRPTAALEDEKGNLCSWIVVRSDGSMGLLHTLPDYRGRGLARFVVKFVSLQIRRWQHRLQAAAAASPDDTSAALQARLSALAVPYCHIALYNTQSEKVFRGLGFKEVNRVTWVISSALTPRLRLRPLNLSSPHELPDLLHLINTSYKQDDAFFVDQTRTDEATVRGMASTGVFFVGYRMPTPEADAAGVGLDNGPFPGAGCWAGHGNVPADACAAHPLELSGSARELLVAVYVSVTDEPVAQAADTGCSAGAAAAPTAKPFPSLGGARLPADAPAQSDGSAAAAADAAARRSLPPMPPAGHERVAHLSMLTIHPSIKRLGLGQRVLDFACATAAAGAGKPCADADAVAGTASSVSGWGATAVDAYVVSVKPWLLNFYTQRNGFSVIGSEPWPAELDHQLILPTFFHKVRKDLAEV